MDEIREICEKRESGRLQNNWEIESVHSFRDKSFSSSRTNRDADIYVAVGLKDHALVKWVLKNMAIADGSLVFIHVYPQLKSIPTAMGNMPISKASPEVSKKHISMEEHKRRNIIQHYMLLCDAAKVKADNVMIESDTVDKTLVELISVMNIKKIVVGTNSATNKKGKPRSGSMAYNLRQNAPSQCEIVMVDRSGNSSVSSGTESEANSPSVSSSPVTSTPTSSNNPKKQQRCLSCSCIGRFHQT